MIGRLLAAAVAAVVVLYGRAWRFDLHCDDLIVIRPWSPAELAAVWHGTWEPQHAWAVFFRPLAAWFYAGSFELFGVHAQAHLTLSILLLVLVTWALAVFVARESGSTETGVAAALIYALHPNTPWSTGTWVTNDFHKLAALGALCALLAWQRRRDRALAAWWPVLFFAVGAFLVKEDQVVLLPTLVALTWLRARWIGAAAPRVLMPGLIATAIAAACWCWRMAALGQLGGFPMPDSAETVARNLLRGPLYVFGAIGNPLDHVGVAQWLTALLAITASAAVIARLPRRQQWPAVCGVVLIAAYSAPLAFISSTTRYYVLTMAGTMILATAAQGLWSLAPRGAARAIAATTLAGLALVAAARQEAAHASFAPCSPVDLGCRDFALEAMPLLPPEARADIATRPEACRAGTPRRLDQTPVLTWGLGPAIVDTMTGSLARGGGPRIVTLFSADATSAQFTVRHTGASTLSPIGLSITVDGRAVTPVVLTNTEWVTTAVPLSRGWRTWLRGAHRADIVVRENGTERDGLEWQPLVVQR